MAQSHNENDTDRNVNCPGIRLDCGSPPKCYTTRNIMRHHLHFRHLHFCTQGVCLFAHHAHHLRDVASAQRACVKKKYFHSCYFSRKGMLKIPNNKTIVTE